MNPKTDAPCLLAVDIGNTTVALGLFQGERLIQHGKISTHQFLSKQAWQKAVAQWFHHKRISPSDVGNCIICSVVPHTFSLIYPVLKKLLSYRITHHAPRTQTLWVVGANLKVPIPNRYKNPNQVGQDRLVNAYAGYLQYGAPLIIVDFGTAVTFDVISRKGEYVGGLIIPGLEVARDSLAERAALLPRVELKAPKDLIGKTTHESILAGLFYGFGKLTDGVVAELKKEIGTAKVIATGGQARLISPFCASIRSLDPHLTLRGLRFLLQK